MAGVKRFELPKRKKGSSLSTRALIMTGGKRFELPTRAAFVDQGNPLLFFAAQQN